MEKTTWDSGRPVCSTISGVWRCENLLLFVGGYFWAGSTTLWQEYQGKLAFERQRELAAEQAKA